MNGHEQDALWQSLQEKVEFLTRPTSYLEECTTVESIETHMSWVFLTNNHAYKLKKPVLLPYMNMISLQQRHLACLRELKLNQFLAADIYRDVVPLIEGKPHQFYPVGSFAKGKTAEWMVKMQRFPREKTLDQAIINNRIDINLLEKAASMLTDFYQQSPPAAVKPETFLHRLEQSLLENKKVLSQPEHGLEPFLVEEVYRTQKNQLKELSNEILARVRTGKIIECHGDLRPEHICLASPPVIIDRLEFSLDLRMMDPIEELAYLFIECDLLGRPDIGDFFCGTYQKALQDVFSSDLFLFYKSCRASLRAKLSIWHIEDPRTHDVDKWQEKIRKYFDYSTIICH
ncbi:phosphotransferase [Legionella spiritensis]|uniref:phosphotransferase n=1 Tax=Legionella spiritensis TaxID=452 RepID=UPI000F6D6B53|nr:phosphotransferase [Legionella spiritensis]VEG90203.1 Uncharacterised protein [Legionella spiritensis]